MDGVQITALTTLVGLFVWYLKTQTKQQAEREKDAYIERTGRQDKRDKEQKEEREYYRGIIKTELQTNEALNTQGLLLQKEMMKDFKDHNGHSEEFSKKVLGAFDIICDRMNGGSPESVALKKKLKEYEEKGVIINRRGKDKPVETERRK